MSTLKGLSWGCLMEKPGEKNLNSDSVCIIISAVSSTHAQWSVPAFLGRVQLLLHELVLGQHVLHHLLGVLRSKQMSKGTVIGIHYCA